MPLPGEGQVGCVRGCAGGSRRIDERAHVHAGLVTRDRRDEIEPFGQHALHLPDDLLDQVARLLLAGPVIETAKRSGPVRPPVTAMSDRSSMSVSSTTRVAARRNASISRIVGRSETRRFGPRIS